MRSENGNFTRETRQRGAGLRRWGGGMGGGSGAPPAFTTPEPWAVTAGRAPRRATRSGWGPGLEACTQHARDKASRPRSQGPDAFSSGRSGEGAA